MGCNLSYDFEPSNRMTKRTGVNQALKNGIRKYLEVSVLILGLNKTGIGVPLVRAYVRFFSLLLSDFGVTALLFGH